MTQPQPPYGHQPHQQYGYPQVPPQQAYQQFPPPQGKRGLAVALGIVAGGVALIHALACVVNNYTDFNLAPALPILGDNGIPVVLGVSDPDAAVITHIVIAVLTIASGVAMAVRQGWARFAAAFGGLVLSFGAVTDAMQLGDPVFFVGPLLLVLLWIGTAVAPFVPPISHEFGRKRRVPTAQPPVMWGQQAGYPQGYPQQGYPQQGYPQNPGGFPQQ